MNTVIYFVRHSEPLKLKKMKYNDSDQIHNEKQPLSVNGEIKAKTLSELSELSNIDTVIASNYVRTIATAKYIAKKNNVDIYINEDFRERRQGVNWEDIPNGFEIKQFNEETYKIGDGENQIEVRERMFKALTEVLEQYKSKRIVITSHATAIMFLFKKWCDINFDGSICKIEFNDKIVFENKWNAPEIFKLIFDEKNNLISIKNLFINNLIEINKVENYEQCQ